jgi:sigma-B regulation protein RsbU (phosphoserine phosphatase)
MESPRVLIADDQAHVIQALELLLKTEGFRYESVNSPDAVVDAVRERTFDALIMDLNYSRDTTSGMEGLQLLSRVHDLDSSLPVVLMTAWGTIELAVEAMQGGGRDFVQKPWDNKKLLDTLRRQIESGRSLREKNREINEARETQQKLLPRTRSQVCGFEVIAFSQPASEIGGDYFDALPVGEDSAAVCVADVAGKGIPAALVMANIQASVRSLAEHTPGPAQLCRELNGMMLKNTRSDRFATFFYGVLNSGEGTLRYTNAGHVPPILIRADGSVERLDEGGTMLGIFPNMNYEETEVGFRYGDKLVIVTDGITEAENAQQEQFGEDRLISLVRKNRELPSSQLQRLLLDSVAAFTSGVLQDDATLMVVSMGEN